MFNVIMNECERRESTHGVFTVLFGCVPNSYVLGD